jgi:hypothetical protein
MAAFVITPIGTLSTPQLLSSLLQYKRMFILLLIELATATLARR